MNETWKKVEKTDKKAFFHSPTLKEQSNQAHVYIDPKIGRHHHPESLEV